MNSEGAPDDFTLVEPFDIDDDSLDGLSPQQCFTLGVEWQMMRVSLGLEESGPKTIHRANCGRILRLAKRHGVELAWEHIDETWSQIDRSRPDEEEADGRT